MKLRVQHVYGLRFLATVGEHAVVVDAAPEDGGGGTAMSAPQMFVAALGACICEFVTNSCRLREISFDQLSVEVEYEELARPRGGQAAADRSGETRHTDEHVGTAAGGGYSIQVGRVCHSIDEKVRR